MAIVIMFCKYIFSYINLSNIVSTFSVIFVAILVYFISIFALKTFNKEQILELPMGSKIYSFVSKFINM